MNVGDFVMFRKRGSQWTSPSPYHYGMITRIDDPYERHFSRKNKYTILCSSGELVCQVKEREIIILSKGKNEERATKVLAF